MVRLGDVIRARRKAQGWTRVTDLAKAARIDKATLVRWERNEVTPQADKFQRLAEILRTTPDELIAAVPQERDPLAETLVRAYTVSGSRTQRAVRILLGLDDRPYTAPEDAPTPTRRHDDPPDANHRSERKHDPDATQDR